MIFTILWIFCLFQATTSAGREGMQQTIEHEHTESGIFEVQLVRLVFKTSANFWLDGCGGSERMLFTTLVKKMMFFVEAPSVHLKRLEQLFVQWRRIVVQPKITSLITLGSWLTINLEKKHAKLVLFICPYNLELYFVLSTNWYYSQLRIRFDSLVCVRLFVGATTIVSKGANSWRYFTLSVFHITRIVLRIQCFYYW